MFRPYVIIPEFQQFQAGRSSDGFHQLLETLPTDLVIGKIEARQIFATNDQVRERFMPLYIIIGSQVIILDIELFQAWVSEQCFEYRDKSLPRDIVAFDLKRYHIPVIIQKVSQFGSPRVSNELIIQHYSGCIFEWIEFSGN